MTERLLVTFEFMHLISPKIYNVFDPTSMNPTNFRTNAVELIVSIIALIKDEIIIVKTSLIGSILSNLLLVIGICFFFGGLRREKEFFNVTVTATTAFLLALAIAAVFIPSAFNRFPNTNNTAVTANQKTYYTASISRGTAIILLFVYGYYLLF